MSAPAIVKRARKQRNNRDTRMIRDFRPPEGVPINFQVAGLGARLAAQVTDLIITSMFVLVLILFLAITELIEGPALWIMASLAFFFIRAPYYIFAELIWNGQTLGKRVCRLRVVSADGRSLRPYSVTVRNLMKEIEVFYPGTMMFAVATLNPGEYLLLLIWIGILLAVPLTNSKRQRLGDMIANTYVIHQPQAILMPDLSTRPDAEVREKFAFLPYQLDHYGAFELQTLEKVLHVETSGHSRDIARRHQRNLKAISEKIRTKIDFTDKVDDKDIPEFLEAFYLAQRRYLESRKLFGDAREDKFHKHDDKSASL